MARQRPSQMSYNLFAKEEEDKDEEVFVDTKWDKNSFKALVGPLLPFFLSWNCNEQKSRIIIVIFIEMCSLGLVVAWNMDQVSSSDWTLKLNRVRQLRRLNMLTRRRWTRVHVQLHKKMLSGDYYGTCLVQEEPTPLFFCCGHKEGTNDGHATASSSVCDCRLLYWQRVGKVKSSSWPLLVQPASSSSPSMHKTNINRLTYLTFSRMQWWVKERTTHV